MADDTRRRWGTAGVRLTPEQARRNDGRNRLWAVERDEKQAENDRIAHAKWRAGLVVPHNITHALDSLGLYGPEVDQECGVREPAVDLWEAGKLYPTWDQLVALAKLTQRPARWFVEARRSLNIYETSMKFHVDMRSVSTREMALMRYPDDVVARCPGTGFPTPDTAGAVTE